MKKIYIVLASSLFSLFAVGQSQRTVLVEEFTNASCPPCAAQNPGFNTLLDANTDQVVSIKYQTAFPGFDPMNQHNPSEVATRLDYYPDLEGVPTGYIDGIIPDTSPSYPGAPGAITQTMLDDAEAVDASFDIELTYTVSPSSVTVEATATCTQAASGDLKFRIAVIEEEILFDSPPGSTNESDFYGVMKKMLPNADGIDMESTYAVGETFTTSQSWDLANVYDIEELAVVVFIQNDNGKEVLQAALAQDAEIIPDGDLDATSTGISGVSNVDCGTTLSPAVTIQNYGSENLTSATINYTAGDASGSVEWTGNLAFYEEEEVELGELNITPGSGNTIEVTVTNPNGSSDENTDNDSVESTLDLAGFVNGTEIEVHFYTDFYALESSWELRNSANDVVGSGGPYAEGMEDDFGGGGPDANTTKVHVVTIDAVDDCFEFRASDSFGDGLQYGAGEGPNGAFGAEIFFEGNSIKFIPLENFGQSFSLDGAMAYFGALSTENNAFESLNVFPNPTTGTVKIESSLLRATETVITVNDITGKAVYQEDLGNLPEGYFFKEIDLSSLQNGVYLMNLTTDSAVKTIRIAVTE